MTQVGKSQSAGGPDVIWLRVQMSDGKLINVQVGPRDYVSKQDFVVVTGDRVHLTGWDAALRLRRRNSRVRRGQYLPGRPHPRAAQSQRRAALDLTVQHVRAAAQHDDDARGGQQAGDYHSVRPGAQRAE